MIKRPGPDKVYLESKGEGLSVDQLNYAFNTQSKYTHTIYVHPDGDGTDGSTWEKGYTTVETAIANASADLDDHTEIRITTGTYDINTAGILTINKNIGLTSLSEFTVVIENTHASATGVFQVQQETIFDGISIRANDITGIEFNGPNVGGSLIKDVVINGIASTSAHTLIKFTGTDPGSIIAKNLKLVGEATSTHTTGLDMSVASTNNIWTNLQVYFCTVGIHLATGSALNEFATLFMYGNVNAVNIDAGAIVTVLKDLDLTNNVTEITDLGTGTTITRIQDIDSFAGVDGYTAILYVSDDGDDSDGKSWAGALHSLWEAIQIASSGTHAMTEIMVASGVYDIDQPGDPTVSKNIHIRGVGGDYSVGVTIKNDHASATSVLKFTGVAGLFNLAIDCGTSNNGVIYSGSGAVNGKLVKVDLVMAGLTSAKTGVLYENCAFHLNERVYFIGNTTYATGMVFNNCQYYIDWDDLYLDCLLGLSSTNAADNFLYFNKPTFNGCIVGTNLSAACNDFVLDEARFVENTTNFTAISTADYHILRPVLDKEIIEMYPVTASGGVTVTGGAADVYGPWSTVIPASTVTKPFKIVSLGGDNSSDLNAYYIFQIAYGPTDIIMATLGFSGGAKSIVVPNFNSGVIPENSQIRMRLQTSNGTGDTADFWVNYVII